jgi:hypothetical protein
MYLARRRAEAGRGPRHDGRGPDHPGSQASPIADLYMLAEGRPLSLRNPGSPLSRRWFRLRPRRGLPNVNRSAHRGYDRNVQICSLTCWTGNDREHGQVTEHNPTRAAVVTLVAAFVVYGVGSALTMQSIAMAAFSEGVGADRERIYWVLGRTSAIVTGLLLASSVVTSVTSMDRALKTWWPLVLSVPALVALIHFDYLGLGFR